LTAPVLVSPTFAKEQSLVSDAANSAGKFLLMSDIHLDPFANPALLKQLIAEPVDQWETIFESSPNDAFAPPGKDANYPLMISALDAAQSHGAYDFAIVTGDYLVHESRALFEPVGGKDEQAYEDFVTKTEIFVAREIQKHLAGVPVYFSLGNNDSECGDYMMATHTTFLKAFAQEWNVLSGHPEALKTMADAGYYELPHPTLAKTKFIVLNDIYWSNRYEEDSCHSQPNDKAGDKELAWLKKRLAKAQKAGEKVILIMHIPPQADVFGTLKAMEKDKKKKPGKLFWADKYEEAFVDLMRTYEGTVSYSFAGHTHMDDFRILSDNNGKPFLVTHISPAVCPIRFNNPAFQVMNYNKTSGAINDMATFYLKNLASAKGVQGGQWELEYDFDKTYGVDGYNAATLKALTDSLDTDESKLSSFARYYVVSAPEIIKPEFWKKINDLRLLSDQKELDASFHQ
jgi:hypothetical protein